MRSATSIHPVALLLILSAGLGACAPAISPLYRDYADERAGTIDGGTVAELTRITRALEAAGWRVEEGTAGATLRTEPRRFRNWGLYTVEVELEAAPVAGDWVRLFVHPYRRFFTGRRSKIPYLRPGLAKAVLEDVTAALEAEGLTYAGYAERRDRLGR